MAEVEIEIAGFDFDKSDAQTNKCEIQFRDWSEIAYSDFFEAIMLKNVPCIIRNVANNWECSKNWVVDNNINYDYITKEYGELEAPVADCNLITFNSQCKQNMKVKEFINYLKENKSDQLLYLKDWHLKRDLPTHNFYEVPFIFASDWLNEFSIDHGEDDFMFVYIGPKDSWTPFHCDVYTSFSWSVNIVGKKKWILLPPGEEEKLKDSLNNLPLLFEPEKYPNVKYIEVFQEMGDGIFVPSGWHHQVFNLANTISINHNFINSCNVELLWKSMTNNLVLVENEIKEFKETEGFIDQCQLILKSDFGMDFVSFFKILTYLADKRLKQINGNKVLIFNKFYFGRRHITYDLIIVSRIVTLVQNHALFSHLPATVTTNVINVKNSINKILNLYI